MDVMLWYNCECIQLATQAIRLKPDGSQRLNTSRTPGQQLLNEPDSAWSSTVSQPGDRCTWIPTSPIGGLQRRAALQAEELHAFQHFDCQLANNPLIADALRSIFGSGHDERCFQDALANLVDLEEVVINWAKLIFDTTKSKAEAKIKKKYLSEKREEELKALRLHAGFLFA
ncbi:unnamed protein product [Nippostrongylus brasiliensis]|uniref:Uncharacterized protein n=1 Tax=Nippostrongylus brasiliensis TaxID=27835 RepID=A0A158QYD5_NIPBR|nr:unnamed protein product [Nippostrongylus brasiliensis]